MKSRGVSRFLFPGRGLIHAALFGSFLGSVGCAGGGTTGHEKLDGDAPVFTRDVGTEAGVDTTIDASVDAGAPDVALDLSQPPDVIDAASEPLGDGARVRDGMVVRDGIILDPSDASDGSETSTDAPPSTICGDGKKEGKEECDDGNKKSGDGCSTICTSTAVCDACITAALKDEAWVELKEAWPLCEYLAGNAMSGEGAGRPRKELCQEVYTCALRSDCLDWKSTEATKCYCGTAVGDACLTGKANGPCRVEIENGVESVLPGIVVSGLTSLGNASGAALRMLVFQAQDESINGLPECRSYCAPGAMPPDGGFPDSGALSDTTSTPESSVDDATGTIDTADAGDAAATGDVTIGQ
jgi:cysteine-rich repeat protein